MSATETRTAVDDRPRFEEAWETRLLDELADCLDGLRVPLNEAQRSNMQGSYPYCGANGILDHINEYVLDDDVILMAEDGGHFDEYLTRPIAYRMSGPIWVNNHAHILKAKPTFEQSFLFYSLVHKDIRSFLASGTRAKLNKGEMVKIEVFAPNSLPEQRAIAAALSDVDDLLQSLDRLIAKKRDIKQGAMQELLTGRTRLPGFSGTWETKRLGEVVDRRAGTYLPRTSYAGGSYAVHGAGGIMGRHDRPSVPEPSTVLGRIGTIGAPRFEPYGCWINNNAVGIVPKSSVAHAFYVHCLLTQLDWGDVTSATAQPFLVLADLLALKYLIPPLPEQRAIAAVLSDMDAEIDALEARRKKVAAIKQGMMQELLTGRTRLPIPQEQSA